MTHRYYDPGTGKFLNRDPIGYAGTKIGDVAYTYDHYGRQSSLTNQVYGSPAAYVTAKAYTYDDLDELLSQTTDFGLDFYNSSGGTQGPQNQKFSYSHNADGSRSQSGSNTPDTQAYQYDGLGRLTAAYMPYAVGGSSNFGESYSYLANGWLSRRQGFLFGSPYLQTDKTYNPRGFLATLTNSLLTNSTVGTQAGLLSSFNGGGGLPMAYDPNGNRLGEVCTVPARPAPNKLPDLSRTVKYGYDRLDQLAQEVSTNTGGTTSLDYTLNFAYDLSGNPTTAPRLTASIFNADNQNAKNGSTSVLYNGNGDPSVVSYFYSAAYQAIFDPEDRLTSSVQDHTNINATYDGDGLRASDEYGTVRTVNNNVSGTTYFLYDGDQPIAEEGNAGEEEFLSLYGADGLAGRWATLANVYTAQTYDPQGNAVEPVALTLSGAYTVKVPTSLAFDGFGVARGSGGYDFNNPVGFGGRFGYYTDSTGLVLLTHRFYDPRLGRFVTRDPIGYKGGINLYGFVGNNPVNRSDPSGFGGARSEEEKGDDIFLQREYQALREQQKELEREQEREREIKAAEARRNSGLGPVLELRYELNPAETEAIWKSIQRQKRNLARISRGQNRAVAAPQSQQSTPNQMQKEVERGQAPAGIHRVDKYNTQVKGEKDHIHLDNDDGPALNRDGTWKHGGRILTNSEKEWISQHGWKHP